MKSMYKKTWGKFWGKKPKFEPSKPGTRFEFDFYTK